MQVMFNSRDAPRHESPRHPLLVRSGVRKIEVRILASGLLSGRRGSLTVVTLSVGGLETAVVLNADSLGLTGTCWRCRTSGRSAPSLKCDSPASTGWASLRS